jgi:hypothetical protein
MVFQRCQCNVGCSRAWGNKLGSESGVDRPTAGSFANAEGCRPTDSELLEGALATVQKKDAVVEDVAIVSPLTEEDISA